MASAIPLTLHEALSGIAGSISLASWIFLLIPQLLENYHAGSADGISITFLCIWMIGDVANLAGAIWAGLVPTVIAIAVYFCFSDALLIAQCLYYNTVNARRRGQKEGAEGEEGGEGEVDERRPLLNGGKNQSKPGKTRRLTDVTDENMGLPGSRRRSSAGSRRRKSSSVTQTVNASQAVKAVAKTSPWVKNSLSIILICVVGAAGWAIAWRTGAWRPVPVEQETDSDEPIGAEILGYFSAVCYLGARIPQIIKNQRERSCDGLSLLFFLLSLLGNATYGAGILFHSVELKYFLTNLPWLIGSLGTMVEDVIIFIQFSVFGEKEESAVA